jgi:hypothetical protein
LVHKPQPKRPQDIVSAAKLYLFIVVIYHKKERVAAIKLSNRSERVKR